MTRAALLPLLTATESLSTATVQELEQLAQAFPYCQTAHVLLAKAAHNQGSMLASQRLRRAATYAADRQLLRQLLEQHVQLPAAPAVDTSTDTKEESEVQPAIFVLAPAEPTEAAIEPSVVPAAELPVIHEAAISASEAESSPVLANEDAPIGETSADVASKPAEGGTETTEPVDLVAPPEEAESQWRGAAVAEVSETGMAAATAPIGSDAPAKTDEVAAAVEEISKELALAEEPVVAPLHIRPSEEAGMARFEFGLSTNLEAGFNTYQLPGLPVEALTGGVVPSLSIPTPSGLAPYMGSTDLSYALGGGSRLGYAMQLAPTASIRTDDALTDSMPGESLPPVGAFFEPDALLLEHIASQPPLAPPAPSPVDLIDSFLRRTPQRRRGIVTLLTVPEQADLSMRSTRSEPDLASESLARILAGQGKIERAISVYERLMVRQPEKSAYFAVQIELLRNPPTPSS